MRPRIEGIADLLLGRMQVSGEAQTDLIRAYALRPPAFVIMDLLDVPRDMQDDFKHWSDVMAVFITGARNSGDKYARAARGCRLMSDYFRTLILERSANPRPGFLMEPINARDEGDAPSTDELVATCILVLFAGHETTTKLIGNAALHLLRHPDRLALLRADPGLIEPAIEEVLRFDGPANALVRVVAQDHRSGIAPEAIDHMVFTTTVPTDCDTLFAARVVGVKSGIPESAGAPAVVRACASVAAWWRPKKLWTGPIAARSVRNTWAKTHRTLRRMRSWASSARRQPLIADFLPGRSCRSTCPTARIPAALRWANFRTGMPRRKSWAACARPFAKAAR